MNNTELLSSISNLLDEKLNQKFDEKLEPINHRLDRIETKVENIENRVERIEDIQNNNILPRLSAIEETQNNEILPRIKTLEINMEHDVIPGLTHIEQCYISTYERYQKGIDQLDRMQSDIDTIKLVVTDHSAELQQVTSSYLLK